MDIEERVRRFDREKASALRRVWFVGDVHGEFKYLARAFLAAAVRPRWIVFAGDVEIDHKPLKEVLAPMWRFAPGVRVAFIYGNHDADSYEHWEMLHDAGDAVALHGTVADMDGVQVAGLGGHFSSKVWYPPEAPRYVDRAEALGGGAFRFRGGQRPAPQYLAAIYPADINWMKQHSADILVTHEAPSCHPRGFWALDGLAREMGVARSFHGHHHDDRTAEYAPQRGRIGFDAVGLRYCQIKNGLAEIIFDGVAG